MDQRNEKIIVYLKVIFLTLLYVGQRRLKKREAFERYLKYLEESLMR